MYHDFWWYAYFVRCQWHHRGEEQEQGEEYGSKSGPFALMSLVRGLAEFTVVRMGCQRREGGEEVSALVSDALNSTRSADGWVRLRLRVRCRCWCIIPLPFWLIDASAKANGKSCSVRWLRMFLSRKTPLQLNISRRDEAETGTGTVTGKMKMREQRTGMRTRTSGERHTKCVNDWMILSNWQTKM